MKAMFRALAAPILFAFAAGAALAVEADSPELRARVAELATEHVTIDSDTPGIQLYLRNKRPQEWAGSAKRTLLFVHGATYPAETAFDLQLDGLSWMDYIAAHGWDVWLVDVRGYGRSTRPTEMEQPADRNAPIVTTEVAIRDVSSAVDHILARRGIPRLNLMGWSWGTTIMGGYAAANHDKVEKLVLYAPVWLRDTPSQLAGSGPLGAYRLVSKDAAKARWLRGVPENKVDGLIPPGWFEAWADATWATDPLSRESGLLRAPNGVIHDVVNYWFQGKPLYDPGEIRAPTLIAHAEWDQDTPTFMAQAVFGLLLNAPARRFVQIGEGTHTVIMERNRMQLFREVQLFLEE
ncbi:MAG: alpha/beta hydrolase [Burkholderiales bacterium]